MWRGPPGLTAPEKKNLREKQRRERLSKNEEWADKERRRLWEKDLRETEARHKAKRPKQVLRIDLTDIPRPDRSDELAATG